MDTTKIVVHDEIPEECTLLVVARDNFMSGWGEAARGSSYAAWACTPAQAKPLTRWVKSRDEMESVRVVKRDGYRPPSHCTHLSIYVLHKEHPALTGK